MPSKKHESPDDLDLTVTSGSDNVFADLGLPDADELLHKSDLKSAIVDAIDARGLRRQSEVAKALGIDQPTVSRLMNGRLREFSVDRLLTFLGRLGRDVNIVVSEAPSKLPGQVRVVTEIDVGLTRKPSPAVEEKLVARYVEEGVVGRTASEKRPRKAGRLVGRKSVPPVASKR